MHDMTSLIHAAQHSSAPKELAKQIIPLIDLTSLNDADNDKIISQLCHDASTALRNVAAVCIYSRFTALAKRLLSGTSIKIATVANFPQGNISLENTLKIIQQSCDNGADEIDVVLPYHAYLNGDRNFAINYIHACKEACANNILLKVILETGALQTPELIINASEDAINAGADFIKTSTGKIAVGATLEATYFMLQVIHAAQKHGKNIGFKAAGGIRTLEQAAPYIYLAKTMMGDKWINPHNFRFGASSLVADLLGHATAATNQCSY